jgi:hypothetical protein
MNSKVCTLTLAIGLLATSALSQSPAPYQDAATDRGIHPKTPMAPSPVNQPFNDPDFGSLMVRVTDKNSNPRGPGGTYQASVGGTDEWSRDGRKFYVNTGGGSILAFGFDPSTMAILPIGGVQAGQGLLLPLRPDATFSRIDSDLLYGTINVSPLTITSYRFSTNSTSTVIDTTTCGTIPALIPGPGIRSDDDVNLSAGDARVSISEGGNQFGRHMFAIVYDKKLGCRWYNTQTGQVGGQWGPAGTVSLPDRYLIRHAHLSRSGSYLKISTKNSFYVWDIGTLNVTACPVPGPMHCSGYVVNGYNSIAGGSAWIDDWNVLKRSLGDLADVTPLVWPLTPGIWGQVKHITWNNDNEQDTAPLCGSAFRYSRTTERSSAWQPMA